VIIISNTACKGFVLRSGGRLTQHVVAHSTSFPLFPKVFFMARSSWVSYVQMESILACKVSCVPILKGSYVLMKSCTVFLVC